MNDWKQYRRTNIAEMRPYASGEDLSDVSVSPQDDPETDHGMIARNPKNHADQWYVARAYFEENFEPVDSGNDADRLAAYERDLECDGEDRSQHTDWLSAGFLQRGAEIDRLEGIIEQYQRATIVRDESVPVWAVKRQKLDNGLCHWVVEGWLAAPAPDLRPDDPLPPLAQEDAP